MSRVDCDIVKDLIPSYLDGICSESSRKAVEEHVQECGKCRSCVEELKNSQIVSQGESQGGIDFLRGVKRYHVRKSVIGAGAFFILLFAVMLIRPPFQRIIEVDLQCLMLPVLMLGAWLLLSDYRKSPELTKGRIAAGAASGLGILYSIVLGGIFYFTLKTGQAPFGMEMSRLGPVLNAQLIVIAVAEFLIFWGFAAVAVKKECSFGVLPVLSLGGCVLSLSYRGMMFTMDDMMSIMTLIARVSLWILVETAGMSIAGVLLQKVQRRQ